MKYSLSMSDLVFGASDISSLGVILHVGLKTKKLSRIEVTEYHPRRGRARLWGRLAAQLIRTPNYRNASVAPLLVYFP